MLLHLDGTLILDLIGRDKFGHRPVLVSGKGVSQLLTFAKLPPGTLEAQAVFGSLKANTALAMCFDNACTSADAGKIAGTCVVLEQKFS